MYGKTLSIFTLVGLYIGITFFVNVIHFRFFTVRVVLYSTLWDVFLAGMVTFAIYRCWLRQRLEITPHEAGLTLAVGLLAGMNYAISIPTVIDRSLSIYILEKLDQRGGAIRHDAFPRVFREEYLPEHRLVDVRLTEQLNSGTIVIENGCVSLTPRGQLIIAFTRFYRMNLLPKKRELMGQMTDALTDPFRNSAEVQDYRCQAK